MRDRQPTQTAEEFSRFYHRECRPVVGLAHAPSWSRSPAEELAQEGFAAAYRRWEQIGGHDDQGGWVRHVVANRSVSHLRRLAAAAGEELSALIAAVSVQVAPPSR